MRIKAVGREGSGFKLLLSYKPRPDHPRAKTVEVASNNLAYGKTWPTREEITAADALAFRKWVEGGMELGFLGGSRPRNLSFPPATRASERVDEREARSMSPIPMSALLAGPAAGSSPTAATSVAAAADAATSAAAVAATAAETFAAAHRERLRHGRDYSWSNLALKEAAQTAAAASAAAEAAVAAATAAARRPAAGIHPEILRCVEGLKTKLVNQARVSNQARCGSGRQPRPWSLRPSGGWAVQWCRMPNAYSPVGVVTTGGPAARSYGARDAPFRRSSLAPLGCGRRSIG